MATKPTAARGKVTRKEKLKRVLKKAGESFRARRKKMDTMSPGEKLARFGSPLGPKSKPRTPQKPFRKLAGALPTAGASLRKAAEQLRKAKKGMKRGGRAK